MKFAIVDDRGLNDLERVNDTKDKLIASLKHDNKLLAKQVSDLLEEKNLRTLDNKSEICYNSTMNTLINNRVRLIQHNIQIQLYNNIQGIYK